MSSSGSVAGEVLGISCLGKLLRQSLMPADPSGQQQVPPPGTGGWQRDMPSQTCGRRAVSNAAASSSLASSWELTPGMATPAEGTPPARPTPGSPVLRSARGVPRARLTRPRSVPVGSMFTPQVLS